MENFTDTEYLEIIAKYFEKFGTCQIHGNISDEIRRIAEKLRRLEAEKEKLH